MTRNKHGHPRAATVLCAATLTGCLAVDTTQDTAPPSTWQQQYATAIDEAYRSAPVNVQWAQEFDDPVLLQVIERVRTENRDLQAAIAAFDAARARLGAARAQFLPQGEVIVDSTRQRQPPPVPGQPVTTTTYFAGAGLNWQLDVFGRTRTGVARAAAQLGGLAAVADDVERLSVALAVANYLSLREVDAQYRLADKNIGVLEQTLRLTRERFRVGDAAQFDVIRQRTELAQARSQLSALRIQRAELVAALSLVTGHTYADGAALLLAVAEQDAAALFDQLARSMAVDKPADMLRRRPDVRAAEYRLQAAVASRELATAELFPRVTFGGRVGKLYMGTDAIDDGGTRQYSFGPTISWGLFSYPTVFAEIEASKADVREARANYEGAVLAALNDTDRSLAAYRDSLEQVAALDAASQLANRALYLAQERYKAGADSLLVLLDAQRTAFTARERALSAKYAALRRKVDIFVALGA